MIIQSACLGELDVPETYILHFPEGISGFEHDTRFAVIEHQPDSPFIFFQSLVSPDVIFVGIDPFNYFNNYQVEIDEEIERDLNLSAEDLPTVVCLVNISEDPRQMTANLVAPLVINQNRRLAKQVVLEKSNYRTKHRVFSDVTHPEDSAGES